MFFFVKNIQNLINNTIYEFSSFNCKSSKKYLKKKNFNWCINNSSSFNVFAQTSLINACSFSNSFRVNVNCLLVSTMILDQQAKGINYQRPCRPGDKSSSETVANGNGFSSNNDSWIKQYYSIFSYF